MGYISWQVPEMACDCGEGIALCSVTVLVPNVVACCVHGTIRHQVPEIAFTGDTTAEFLQQPGLDDVLRARLLIMEMSFLDDSVTVEEVGCV
jgi:hypothetical protein